MATPYPRAVTHVGVTVTDLDKAVQWYQDVLGLAVLAGPVDLVADDSHFGQLAIDIFGANFSSGRIAFLAGGNGFVVEIFEFTQPKSERRVDNFEYWKNGFFHICFVDPDIEAVAEKIEATGGKVRSKIWQLFTDPDGIVLQLQDVSYCGGSGYLGDVCP